MFKKITDTTKKENFGLHLAFPGAIEAQEKKGQNELVNSSQLPALINSYTDDNIWEFYEKVGIKLLEDKDNLKDELFIIVELPEGWSIKPTDHSMWSRLVDGNGRERASIFYKAAFYDRSSFLNLNRRFNIEQIFPEDSDKKYKDYYENKNNEKIQYCVKDGEKILFQTEEAYFTKKYLEENHREWFSGYEKMNKDECDLCYKWLEKNYPDWESVFAYWDK